MRVIADGADSPVVRHGERAAGDGREACKGEAHPQHAVSGGAVVGDGQRGCHARGARGDGERDAVGGLTGGGDGKGALNRSHDRGRVGFAQIGVLTHISAALVVSARGSAEEQGKEEEEVDQGPSARKEHTQRREHRVHAYLPRRVATETRSYVFACNAVNENGPGSVRRWDLFASR